MPSVVYDIPIDVPSRIVFLEDRLRELSEARQNPLDSSAKLARVDTEIAMINLMISHYRAATDIEKRLNERSTDS